MKHNKRLLALSLFIVMLFSFSAAVWAKALDGGSGAAGELTLAANAEEAGAGAKILTILHFNDLHANVMEDEDNGLLGLAKFKTYADGVSPDLILDAGDSLHGTTFATISEGANMREVLDLAGIDAAAAGNHDFNYGTDRLIELSRDGRYPVLAANFVNSADGSGPFPANMIFERQGVKIGVFGLTTPETKTASNPKNTEGYEFSDLTAAAKEQVAYLQGQDVDIIVALVHIGLDDSKPLAAEVDGIDIIIDGHSHDTLPAGEVIDGTLIASTGCHLQNIGRIELEIDDSGAVVSKTASLIPYSEASQLTADAELATRIEELDAQNVELGKTILGKATVFLDGERENVRTSETNLGNLVAEVMLAETGADIAMTNGGGIRASIPEGQITMNHVITTFPFTNYSVVIEISGSDLIAAINHGLSADLDEDGNLEQNGGFPQIAGMRVVYDKTRQAGERVVMLTVGGQLVDTEANYSLVTNDFLAAGGDGFDMFAEAAVLSEHELLSEALVNYITSEDTIKTSTDGRVAELVDASASAVKKAEEDLTESSIALAQALIDELPEDRYRDELQEHLDIISEVRDDYTEMLVNGNSRSKVIVTAVMMVLGGIIIIISLKSDSSKKVRK